VGGERAAPPIPDPSTPVTCPSVRTHRRRTPRWCRAGAGGRRPGIRGQSRTTRLRPAPEADSRETRRPAAEGPRRRLRPRSVMVPARRRGSRHQVMAGRRSRRADRTIPGRMTAGWIMCSQHLAPGGAGGPQPPARSPAGRVIFMPTAVPGVVSGLRPTRRPIVAGGTAVTLPDAKRPGSRHLDGLRKAAWPGRPLLRRRAGSSAAPISWTGGRMTTPARTITPEAVAGGVVCSAGAAVRPIQNLITTPGAVTHGAEPAVPTPWPRLRAERGAGGPLPGCPRHRLVIQSPPAGRFRPVGQAWTAT
jgi:hypothetical protein